MTEPMVGYSAKRHEVTFDLTDAPFVDVSYSDRRIRPDELTVIYWLEDGCWVVGRIKVIGSRVKKNGDVGVAQESTWWNSFEKQPDYLRVIAEQNMPQSRHNNSEES
ncbi:hypothetical protein ACFRAQ_34830 [Nocardia sp. NPDC056611]|uniref:hypothetical protein n=1 Tax=Nocardia sp. NPDC056611 TaxID=3345877 RepID=UPI00366DDBFF